MADEVAQIVAHDEIRALLHEGLDRRRGAGTPPAAEHVHPLAGGDVGVLLGPRQREFRLMIDWVRMNHE
jgi:hypothetical protein